ncbi:hypothetical protein [Siphonobacter sp. SORGH_AS_0500]|uniref:hypothetical protein n=1 Tax=Siphonobacter sp. SORGH_AS_0500 TaxID=1864824 RepID=UPI00286CAB7D|nr:hypothetical protein [Siphonobacter sp. SORGH_AS_0500]
MAQIQNTTAKAGGVGFLPLLFLVFLVLKLTSVIDWSWWWVTAPLWGVMALLVIGFFLWFLIMFIRVLIRVTKREAKK